MLVRVLRPIESSLIAQLHILEFNNFFLTSLGKRFLSKFYLSIINHKYGIALGCFHNDELIGFAIGTNISKGFYKSILKSNLFSFTFASLYNLILNPKSILRIFKNLFLNDTKQYIGASLLSICVNSKYANNGIGESLLKSFEKVAFINAGSITLTTDKFDNIKVNHFYQKNCYRLFKEIKQGNRTMNLYIKLNNEK